jgi:16S rRNA (guanine966-N2)-methyltransferase
MIRIYIRQENKLSSLHPLEPFSLAFLDPPYGRGLGERALLSAHAGHWLTPDALVVVEEAAEAAFIAPESFEEIERRSYGESELVFLRSG